MPRYFLGHKIRSMITRLNERLWAFIMSKCDSSFSHCLFLGLTSLLSWKVAQFWWNTPCSCSFRWYNFPSSIKFKFDLITDAATWYLLVIKHHHTSCQRIFYEPSHTWDHEVLSSVDNRGGGLCGMEASVGDWNFNILDDSMLHKKTTLGKLASVYGFFQTMALCHDTYSSVNHSKTFLDSVV